LAIELISITFVAASDRPFPVDPANSRLFASTFLNEDELVLNDTKAIKKILNNPLTDISEQILLRKDLFKITDDNMAVEYRNKIRYFFNPEMSWDKMFKRLF